MFKINESGDYDNGFPGESLSPAEPKTPNNNGDTTIEEITVIHPFPQVLGADNSQYPSEEEIAQMPTIVGTPLDPDPYESGERHFDAIPPEDLSQPALSRAKIVAAHREDSGLFDTSEGPDDASLIFTDEKEVLNDISKALESGAFVAGKLVEQQGEETEFRKAQKQLDDFTKDRERMMEEIQGALDFLTESPE